MIASHAVHDDFAPLRLIRHCRLPPPCAADDLPRRLAISAAMLYIACVRHAERRCRYAYVYDNLSRARLMLREARISRRSHAICVRRSSAMITKVRIQRTYDACYAARDDARAAIDIARYCALRYACLRALLVAATLRRLMMAMSGAAFADGHATRATHAACHVICLLFFAAAFRWLMIRRHTYADYCHAGQWLPH